MNELIHTLLQEFKGDTFIYGSGVLAQARKLTAEVGTQVALVRSTYTGRA